MARLFDDGASEYLTGSFSLSGEPFTLAAWCYIDDVTIDQEVLSVGDSGNPDYCAIEIRGSEANDLVHAKVFNGGVRKKAVSTAGVSVNTWHHTCGVFTASNSRAAYLDGGNKGTNADILAAPTIDLIRTAVSADSTPSLYMSGGVAEAAVWDVALTDAEVAILGLGYSPLFVRPQNLVAYYSLFRDEDQDRVGGYDLTPVNTPSIMTHPAVLYPVSSYISLETEEAAPPAPGDIAASLRYRTAYKSQDD